MHLQCRVPPLKGSKQILLVLESIFSLKRRTFALASIIPSKLSAHILIYQSQKYLVCTTIPTNYYPPFINYCILLRATDVKVTVAQCYALHPSVTHSYVFVYQQQSFILVCMYVGTSTTTHGGALQQHQQQPAMALTMWVGEACRSSTGSTEPQKQQQSTGKPRREQRPLKRPPRLLSRIV